MSEEHKKTLVLIVEDEKPLRQALLMKLQDEGFDVIEARDGASGLELAREHHPDVILMDIVMPKMSGVEALKELRTDEWGKTVKVIFLTNLSENESVSEVLEAGGYDYLIKSDWKIEDIITKIREVIAR